MQGGSAGKLRLGSKVAPVLREPTGGPLQPQSLMGTLGGDAAAANACELQAAAPQRPLRPGRSHGTISFQLADP